MTNQVEPGVVLRAAHALSSGQDTFTGTQVAVLLALAYRSGYDAGREDGQDEMQAQVFQGLMYALGGPDASSMKDAVRTHLAAIDRKRAREEWAASAREPRPHGLDLDDPQWPAVAVPGQQPTQLPHNHDHSPAGGRPLQRVA
ncbi:hypothetical protein [Micromonospora chalcea]|uniref:hypothetical protein n=1 Tax=Micromonospora chalcea TaxID=1874 RepID=UPI003D729313